MTDKPLCLSIRVVIGALPSGSDCEWRDYNATYKVDDNIELNPQRAT